MAEFSVKIEGMEKITTAFSKSPETANRVFGQAIKVSVDILAKYTNTRTVPVGATNQLYQRWERSIQRLVGRWFPTVSYARDVEYGRGPTTIPYDSVEFTSLQKWAEKKNLNAYAVRNSIKKYGTEAHPYIEKIKKAAQSEINKTFREALQVFTKALATKP